MANFDTSDLDALFSELGVDSPAGGGGDSQAATSPEDLISPKQFDIHHFMGASDVPPLEPMPVPTTGMERLAQAGGVPHPNTGPWGPWGPQQGLAAGLVSGLAGFLNSRAANAGARLHERQLEVEQRNKATLQLANENSVLKRQFLVEYLKGSFRATGQPEIAKAVPVLSALSARGDAKGFKQAAMLLGVWDTQEVKDWQAAIADPNKAAHDKAYASAKGRREGAPPIAGGPGAPGGAKPMTQAQISTAIGQIEKDSIAGATTKVRGRSVVDPTKKAQLRQQYWQERLPDVPYQPSREENLQIPAPPTKPGYTAPASGRVLNDAAILSALKAHKSAAEARIDAKANLGPADYARAQQLMGQVFRGQ